MEYKLLEEYFETPVFQNTVQKYFDTVLNDILNYKDILSAKGWFNDDKTGKLIKADLYDMPYHIHILNGLIPALFVYEQLCIKEDLIEHEEIEKYLKTFMLGFTFHDTNKLTATNWENAFTELDKIINNFNVTEFFTDFETFKNDVYFLALSTENGTEVMKNQYKVSLDFQHLTEILEPLCNFGDGLASIKELDGVEVFYKEAEKVFAKISQITKLEISYIKVHENPFTLLSQNLLNTAGRVLSQNGCSILYTMRDGILFFGEDLKDEEKKEIFTEFEEGNDDLDIIGLTKVDAQKCNFGFLGSVELEKSLLNNVIEKLSDKFLLLSPNGQEKFEYFDDFIKFNEQLIAQAELPINIKINNNKLYLNFSEMANEDKPDFIKIFVLQKIIWLNSKLNKTWDKDLKKWIISDEEFSFELNEKFQISEDNEGQKIDISISKISDLKTYFSSITKSANALLKTYIALIKTVNILNSFEDDEEQEQYISDLYNEVLNFYSVNEKNEKNVLSELSNKYFTFKGNKDFSVIIENVPNIPIKKTMCAYTGKIGTEKYVESIAFGMNARGFSNRTVASLQNTTSYVSKLMAEENKLRKSAFSRPKSNHVVYYDFFETALDINLDLIKNSIKSRNLDFSKDGIIKFDNAAKFQPTLKNLEFTEIGSDMLSSIWFIRNKLIIVKKLNMRMYITGIMSPYQSHKEAFVYENAPRFAKDLNWTKVRLYNIEMVLDEISLLFELGKSRKSINTGLVLNYAESPDSIFRAFYEFAMRKKDNEIRNAKNKLRDFINKYPHKFKNMTTIEKLVDIALQIKSSAKSGSEETWLIRTALDFIRKNRKEEIEKDDTIQQIGGNIHKTLRQEKVNSDVIVLFAKTVYEELYENQWGKNLPTINRQKDWIYQFGFVFKMRVDELISERSDDKILNQLKEKKLEINQETILTMLSEKQKYFSDIIIERILNKANN